MSTQTPDNETDETESTDNNTDFSVEAVRRRLTGTLTGKQERVGVCLLRNPDAPLTAIGRKAGVSSTTVLNALKSLVNEQGLDEDGKAEAWSKRGGIRRARTYSELTPKQKAVIDWAARHEGTREDLFDPEAYLTSEKVANAIEHDKRYDVALHSTYPNKVLQDPPTEGEDSRASYGHLVEDRREVLAAKGELDEDTEEAAVESLRVKPPRALLEAAGWDLPESNLDSLDEAAELTEQERLDKAWENAQSKDEEEPVTEEDRREHSAPYGCPECGHQDREDFCSKCGTDKRYEWAKEDEGDTADGERDERPAHAADLTEGADEEAEDLSEEISEPLVQDAEALEDALTGLTERLNEVNVTRQDPEQPVLALGHELPDRLGEENGVWKEDGERHGGQWGVLRVSYCVLRVSCLVVRVSYCVLRIF